MCWEEIGPKCSQKRHNTLALGQNIYLMIGGGSTLPSSSSLPTAQICLALFAYTNVSIYAEMTLTRKQFVRVAFSASSALAFLMIAGDGSITCGYSIVEMFYVCISGFYFYLLVQLSFSGFYRTTEIKLYVCGTHTRVCTSNDFRVDKQQRFNFTLTMMANRNDEYCVVPTSTGD